MDMDKNTFKHRTIDDLLTSVDLDISSLSKNERRLLNSNSEKNSQIVEMIKNSIRDNL